MMTSDNPFDESEFDFEPMQIGRAIKKILTKVSKKEKSKMQTRMEINQKQEKDFFDLALDYIEGSKRKSADMNLGIIMGRLGLDPKMQDERKSITLRVATNYRTKDQSGEYKDNTTWHWVEVPYSRYPEGLELRKGDRVQIAGFTSQYPRKGEPEKKMTGIKFVGMKIRRETEERTNA